jgi:hypothetical protein
MRRISYSKLKILLIILISLILNLRFTPPVIAGPTSGSYQLLDYGFGSGGVATSSSNNFMLQGITGEIETGSPSSSNFILWPGLTYTLQPNVPFAPVFTNPSNYYNKLQLSINQSSNSTDTTYAIGISTDGFVNNIKYVQADGTLNANPVFQGYAIWQPSSNPVIIIGLTPGTTYYARVAASRGTFTQGMLGPTAIAATVNPTFTFSIQTSTSTNPPFSVGIGVINAGQVTTSWQSVTATISTNANNGGTIYLYGNNAGLVSATAGNYKINSASSNLGSVLEGYGAQGTSVSGAPMELLSPYNVVGNSVGILDSTKRPFADSTGQQITNGSATFQLKAKASTTTPAANDYSDTLTVIASGSF